MKICNKCGIEKNINEFPKDRKVCKVCKICNNEYMKKYHSDRKDILNTKMKEYRINNKVNIKDREKTYYENNKDKKKLYYENNKDKKIEYSKTYHKNNKDKINEYTKIYKKKRYADPTYKLISNIRCLIYQSFKNQGVKKDTKTFNILGCSYNDFQIYLENQFEPWMTLENHGIYTGNYNETWQLDHIQPISNASNLEKSNK